MQLLDIPFNEWSRKRVLDGSKTATSRTKRYGNYGDYFKVDDQVFELDLVVKLPLWFISEYLSASEGAISKTEFIKVWIEIHPIKGWIQNQEVFYHHFKRKE